MDYLIWRRRWIDGHALAQPETVDVLLAVLDKEWCPIKEVCGRKDLLVHIPVARNGRDSYAINDCFRADSWQNDRRMQAPLEADIQTDIEPINIGRNRLLMGQFRLAPSRIRKKLLYLGIVTGKQSFMA